MSKLTGPPFHYLDNIKMARNKMKIFLCILILSLASYCVAVDIDKHYITLSQKVVSIADCLQSIEAIHKHISETKKTELRSLLENSQITAVEKVYQDFKNLGENPPSELIAEFILGSVPYLHIFLSIPGASLDAIRPEQSSSFKFDDGDGDEKYSVLLNSVIQHTEIINQELESMANEKNALIFNNWIEDPVTSYINNIEALMEYPLAFYEKDSKHIDSAFDVMDQIYNLFFTAQPETEAQLIKFGLKLHLLTLKQMYKKNKSSISEENVMTFVQKYSGIAFVAQTYRTSTELNYAGKTAEQVIKEDFATMDQTTGGIDAFVIDHAKYLQLIKLPGHPTLPSGENSNALSEDYFIHQGTVHHRMGESVRALEK